MHSGRGLAGTLLRAGLDALAARGCDRFKVSHELANPAAEWAYLGAGFRHSSARRGLPTHERPIPDRDFEASGVDKGHVAAMRAHFAEWHELGG